jgi:hypothetical protein
MNKKMRSVNNEKSLKGFEELRVRWIWYEVNEYKIEWVKQNIQRSMKVMNWMTKFMIS